MRRPTFAAADAFDSRAAGWVGLGLLMSLLALPLLLGLGSRQSFVTTL